MSRAVRVLFHLAAVASGAISLLAVGIWLASYGSAYVLSATGVRSVRQFAVSRGELMVAWVAPDDDAGPVPSSDTDWVWERLPPASLIAQSAIAFPGGSSPFPGFYFHLDPTGDFGGACFLLPIPFVVFLFLFLPLAELMLLRRRRRRKRRAAAGLCVRCGYDLRGTPDRCPECGAVPTTKAARPGGSGG
jgi:hypothetical protein